MSYIRGALPNLIYNPNTQDDLLPDGLTSTFELSQEVPGGYEGNVQVIRREFKSDLLIENSSVSIFTFIAGTNEISCSDAAVSAALSILNIGEIIEISGATNPSNNGEFLIGTVSYDGTSITLGVIGVLANETGSSITAVRKFVGPWETIEPIVDYTISGVGPQYNKLINLSKTPIEQDVITVIHRGEATFNFVPTQKTVGPDQLQDNLRNFVVDIFAGTGAQTAFVLSQVAVSPRSIEVSVNGVVKYGDDTDLAFTGDFALSLDGLTITFHSAPANSAKIYVRHLGFTTVSRRQTLTPSQVGSVAPGAIGILELANGAVTEPKIADGAVSASKIQINSINGTKILLENNEYLNAKDNLSASQGIIKLDAANKTTVRSVGGTLSLNISDSRLIQFSTNLIADGTGTAFIDLGSSGAKFKNLFLSATANVAAVVASGNVGSATSSTTGDATVGGNLIVTGNIDGVNIAALQSQVNALTAVVSANTPPGSIHLWPSAVAPSGWFLCNGASYSTTTYAALFTQIGYLYGGAGASFNVPDFRGRFPLGKSAAGTGSTLAGTGGSLDHTHSTPAHTHGLGNHIHAIPPHFHYNNPAHGSDLRIVSSGTHTTQLDHFHVGTYTGYGSTLALPVSDGAHTHPISDPSHTHQQVVSDHPGGAGDDGVTIRFDRVSDWSIGLPRNTFDQGSRTRSSPTGISVLASTPGPIPAAQTSAHYHYVQIPSYPGFGQGSGASTSDGAHIHATSDFAGSIGNLGSGNDGNGGFSSGVPTPNLSDSGGAATTGGNNPAFISTNFIIKS